MRKQVGAHTFLVVMQNGTSVMVGGRQGCVWWNFTISNKVKCTLPLDPEKSCVEVYPKDTHLTI